MLADQPLEPEYDIVLSFAGEDRNTAEAIADLLKKAGVKVFYDRYEQAELWGKDLYEHLSSVYRSARFFCLMLVSRHYAEKMWTRQERRSAQARALQEKMEYILPLRLDDTELPGLLITTAYIDLRKTTLEEVRDLVLLKILKKKEQN